MGWIPEVEDGSRSTGSLCSESIECFLGIHKLLLIHFVIIYDYVGLCFYKAECY